MEPVSEDWERGLAVVAHPDDLEYGAAGAIARWTAQGKTITYLLVTSGEAGIDALDPTLCGPRREAEERAGAAIVGVTDVEFLRWPDGTVTGGIELRRAIAGVIRRCRPEMVLTLTFETEAGGSVNHADHRAVGLATVDAVRDAANRWVFPELGAAWSGVQATYAFGASEPTHFVDVTLTMDAAVQSLTAHKAYLDGLGGDFNTNQFLRSNAARAGAEVDCGYAVEFRLY
ncbi:MAG: family deacetylase [Ilumatobacteraceae bacterium]|nr:family deacetylase [Ilumatobacteraceae bacterium]